jgi:hypothetical protein
VAQVVSYAKFHNQEHRSARPFRTATGAAFPWLRTAAPRPAGARRPASL